MENVYKWRSSVFWDITPCSPLKVNRRFGGRFLLHLQGRKWENPETSVKQMAVLIEAGDMFLRNVGLLSKDYKMLLVYPRTLHNHRCENLTSYVWTIVFKTFFYLASSWESDVSCYVISRKSLDYILIYSRNLNHQNYTLFVKRSPHRLSRLCNSTVV
jgi:hypothetical protein